MTITINGKDYLFEVSSWWGPQYTFETIMDVANHPERRFNPTLSLHQHVMLYCVLMNDNDNLDLTIEDFFKALEDISLVNKLTEFYAKRVEQLTQTVYPKDEAPASDSKKKSSRRTRSMRG